MKYSHFYKVKPKKPPETLSFRIEQFLDESSTLTRVTIVILAASGVLTLAAVAPNILWAIGKLTKDYKSFQQYRRRKRRKHSIEKTAADTIYYLRKKGYIELKGYGEQVKAVVTEKGKKLLQAPVKITERMPWDGKWWLVAADIPTKTHRHSADRLRRSLMRLGFYSLQRTLWLYPYNPTVVLNQITNQLNVGKYVSLMEVSRLDSEDSGILKKYFKL